MLIWMDSSSCESCRKTCQMLIGFLKKFFGTEEFMQENPLFFLHESYTTNCILNKK